MVQLPNILLFIFLILFSSIQAKAQPVRTPEQDSILSEIRRNTQLDYQIMLDLLKISTIRQGANGRDPSAANAANYLESKANPFPDWPDPLVADDGSIISSQGDWWNIRRPEIIEHFDREIYGRVPAEVPKVSWQIADSVTEQLGSHDILTRKLVGLVDNSLDPETKVEIQLSVTTPSSASEPVPLVMQFSFNWPSWFPPRPRSADQWKKQLLDEGWGYAELLTTSIQEDNGAGLVNGIIGLTNKGQRRNPEDWGSLRAWAWGASRALDFFESDPMVDAEKVGITGHSRYGKAAAVAMAYDQRFAIAYVSSSGAGGLKPHRRNYGELIENVAAPSEYHWMAGNYIKYAGPLTWDDLPVDAHHLIALCAPRPVFVGCGSVGDRWVDPRGMFMACVEAGPVYQLLGKKDLGATEFPAINTAISEGDIAYRQHSGGHSPGPNWSAFIEFAKKYFASE